jgi:hypothetical protein
VSNRTYAIVVIAAAALILIAVALRGQGAEALTAWLAGLHGR